MFLEYAFVVSGQGDKDEAYDVLAAAADASVWYHYKDKVRQIHICWFSKLIRITMACTFTHVCKSVRSSSIR
jgi:general transcription factor 3C polypeptide 3 (transcription factor C subunit 4)